MQCRFIGRVWKDVPGAENEVLKFRERQEILNQGYSIIGPLSQANRSHLCETSDGLSDAFLDSFDSGNECRTHRAQADQQNAELTLCGSDFCPLLNCHY